MIDDRVSEAVEQHKLKMDWLKTHTPGAAQQRNTETNCDPEISTEKESDLKAFSSVKRHWE